MIRLFKKMIFIFLGANLIVAQPIFADNSSRYSSFLNIGVDSLPSQGLQSTSGEMSPPSVEIMGNSVDIRESDIQGNSNSLYQVAPAQKPIIVPPSEPGVYPPKRIPPPVQRPDTSMTPSFRKGCGGYAVCDPFYQEFKACEPTCEPIGYHSKRNDPGSCHHSGRAIDVFGMKCSDTGRTYSAINNGRYQDMVKCVKKRQRLKVIWHNGSGRTSGHHDHAHFSVTCHGGGYW